MTRNAFRFMGGRVRFKRDRRWPHERHEEAGAATTVKTNTRRGAGGDTTHYCATAMRNLPSRRKRTRARNVVCGRRTATYDGQLPLTKTDEVVTRAPTFVLL